MDKNATLALVLGTLLSLSELLALIPTVKSNSIFQLIQNGLKAVTSISDKSDTTNCP